MSSNFENTGKTMTADLTTNCDAEMNTSLPEKIKNVRGHNFEGGANDSESDKDTNRSNSNSKVEYLSLALLLNILFLLLVFIGFNTCKIRFDFLHNHCYYCTSDHECWFALRMELYVLCRRHDEYS